MGKLSLSSKGYNEPNQLTTSSNQDNFTSIKTFQLQADTTFLTSSAINCMQVHIHKMNVL